MPKRGWLEAVQEPEKNSGTGKRPGRYGRIQVPMQRTPSEREYAVFLSRDPEAQGHRIFLRFDGVNCRTRVFKDGRPAGEHYGGLSAGIVR
ncbi:MAG: hypothetical protein ACLVAW_20080 [Eisenbergiella massiliensis]